jgi:hypothetical protein
MSSFRQVLLQYKNIFTVTWVDSNVKKNENIQLKNDDRLWHVKEAYQYVMEKKNINRGWNVGGI